MVETAESNRCKKLPFFPPLTFDVCVCVCVFVCVCCVCVCVCVCHLFSSLVEEDEGLKPAASGARVRMSLKTVFSSDTVSRIRTKPGVCVCVCVCVETC